MNITDVRVRKIKTEGKMKAVASITIEDCFVVHDIKIIEGNNGYFIAMPSRKVGEGDFKDVAHPINTETRNQIQDLIFDNYLEEYGQDLRNAPIEAEAVEEDTLLEDNAIKSEIEFDSTEEVEFEAEDIGSATTL